MPEVNVRIPSPLRKLTNGTGQVPCTGLTVRQILEDLDRQHPGVRDRICDENGEVRRFVNIFLGEDDIRFLSGLETQTADGKDISIIPAMAGGSL